jgi:hypothetical protein
MVIMQALRYSIAGTLLGIAVLALFASPLSSALYGVKVSDPLVAAGTALLLGGIAVAAAALPARRVAKIPAATVLQGSD